MAGFLRGVKQRAKRQSRTKGEHVDLMYGCRQSSWDGLVLHEKDVEVIAKSSRDKLVALCRTQQQRLNRGGFPRFMRNFVRKYM